VEIGFCAPALAQAEVQLPSHSHDLKELSSESNVISSRGHREQIGLQLTDHGFVHGEKRHRSKVCLDQPSFTASCQRSWV
jgi:hypothetical protein